MRRKGGIFGEGAWESAQQAAHGRETVCSDGRRSGSVVERQEEGLGSGRGGKKKWFPRGTWRCTWVGGRR